MKIGDKIRTIGFHKGLEGTITRIREGVDSQNHGTIEIRVEKINVKKNFNWLNPGDLEHFAHFGWEKNMEIVEEIKQSETPRYCLECDEQLESLDNTDSHSNPRICIKHLRRKLEQS